MPLVGILLFFIVLVVVAAVFVLGTGGAVFITVFGDVIIAILVIGWIIKMIINR